MFIKKKKKNENSAFFAFNKAVIYYMQAEKQIFNMRYVKPT